MLEAGEYETEVHTEGEPVTMPNKSWDGTEVAVMQRHRPLGGGKVAVDTAVLRLKDHPDLWAMLEEIKSQELLAQGPR